MTERTRWNLQSICSKCTLLFWLSSILLYLLWCYTQLPSSCKPIFCIWPTLLQYKEILGWIQIKLTKSHWNKCGLSHDQCVSCIAMVFKFSSCLLSIFPAIFMLAETDFLNLPSMPIISFSILTPHLTQDYTCLGLRTQSKFWLPSQANQITENH